MLEISTAVLIAAVLILVAGFTSLLAFRFGAPLLLVFLLLGLLVGEDGLGIHFDDASLAFFIGSLALAVILFDSGFGTKLSSLKAAAAPAIVLATLGVLFTTGLVGAAAHFTYGFPWLEAFLVGAVISSTDAAAVFFLLRVGGITIQERVRTTLEIESESNDPMAIFLTITLVELMLANNQQSALSHFL
jgi:cell volume regulation protein A